MLRLRTGIAGMLVVAGVTVSCSKPAPEPAPEPKIKPAALTPQTSGYAAGDLSGAGTLKGTVTLDGAKPPTPLVRCTKDLDVCGKPRPSQALLVGPNNAVKNAIVWLTDIHTGKAAITAQGHIDIKQCAYNPRVQAVLVKGNLMVTNQDLIPHDFNGSIGSRSLFNRTVLGKSEIVDLYTPGMLTIGCDTHGSGGTAPTCETGVIGVMPNPYFTVTGEDGQYVIPDVPPGNYTLQVWHETLGQQDQRVTLGAGATVASDFKLVAKAK